MREETLYKETKNESVSFKRAMLVGGYLHKSELLLCQEHLNELRALSYTLGFEVVKQFPCMIRKIDPATFLGKGKVEELSQNAVTLNADIVIFDAEISPNQQRNLEHVFKLPLIDRTELILEIFSQRAHTKEAKLQIELAKHQYQLPRLRGLWAHLSRQVASGKGFLKGEGERQIELDKRIARSRIAQLKKEIEEVKSQRDVQRQARMRNHIPTFAIIGYTNVGKSTLLNRLTKANVLIEDKLFATLDTTTRRFSLPNHQDILLIDTVGFIRKIPHTLIEAFKSTLEEVVYTDILLHLIDANHPMAEEHAKSTYEVLKELHAEKTPIITLLNKIDLVENRKMLTHLQLKYPRVVGISARTGEGMDQLMHMIMDALKKLRMVVTLSIPQKNYALINALMDKGRVIKQSYKENNMLIKVEIPTYMQHRVEQYTVDAFADS